MAHSVPHALAMCKEKAVVIHDIITVYVLAHHHYTCNDTGRLRLRTGPVQRLGMCLSCGCHSGWFLKSSSSPEFLLQICSRTRSATAEPAARLQRRSACSSSASVTFTGPLICFRSIYPAEYCLQGIS